MPWPGYRLDVPRRLFKPRYLYSHLQLVFIHFLFAGWAVGWASQGGFEPCARRSGRRGREDGCPRVDEDGKVGVLGSTRTGGWVSSGRRGLGDRLSGTDSCRSAALCSSVIMRREGRMGVCAPASRDAPPIASLRDFSPQCW
jgi:hypothetical protein